MSAAAFGGRLLHRSARLLSSRGRRRAAGRIAAWGLDLAEGSRRSTLADVVDGVGLRFTLAGLAGEVADHPAAVRHLEQAVQRLRSAESRGERDVWLQEALVRLGDHARRDGHHDRAQMALAEALEMAEGAGLDPVRRAAVHNALGILAKDRGDHSAAERHYREALELLQTSYGAGAPELASVHHNFAGLAHARHQFVEAEAHARRALKCRRADPAMEVSALAGDLSVLGAVLVGRGQLDRAEEVLREAMGLWVDLYGDEHYELAVCLNNLGALHEGRGDGPAARASWEAALRIKERVLRHDHPEITALRHRLGEPGELL